MNNYKVYFNTGNSYSTMEIHANKYFTVDKLVIFKEGENIKASFSIYNIIGIILQPPVKKLDLKDMKKRFYSGGKNE